MRRSNDGMMFSGFLLKHCCVYADVIVTLANKPAELFDHSLQSSSWWHLHCCISASTSTSVPPTQLARLFTQLSLRERYACFIRAIQAVRKAVSCLLINRGKRMEVFVTVQRPIPRPLGVVTVRVESFSFQCYNERLLIRGNLSVALESGTLRAVCTSDKK
jgi:hypothetical protein